MIMIEMVRPSGSLRTQAQANATLHQTLVFLNDKIELDIDPAAVQIRLVPGVRLWGGLGVGRCETTQCGSKYTAVIELKEGLACDFAVVALTHELTHFWMNSNKIAPSLLFPDSQKKNAENLDETICELMGAIAAQAMRCDRIEYQQLQSAKQYANGFGRGCQAVLSSHIDKAITLHSSIAGALMGRYLCRLNLSR